ncbi:MAG: RNA-binding S4 domain-containing protein [Actinobacteria bacterium]|nr:RNA-binding S4 domain-containing protein [Actinomycetota bacterium]
MVNRRTVDVDEGITLGQFLKFAGVAGTGGHAKALVEEEGVVVNGDAETRRGRKLRHGDVVRVGNDELTVARRSGGGRAGSSY